MSVFQKHFKKFFTHSIKLGSLFMIFSIFLISTDCFVKTNKNYFERNNNILGRPTYTCLSSLITLFFSFFLIHPCQILCLLTITDGRV